MAVPIPNTFTAGTTARAAEVNANFTAIANKFNNNIDINDVASSLENAFLKLATAADRKIAWGTVSTPAFDGTNGSRASGSFAHGLGATPVTVQFTGAVLQLQGGSGNYPIWVGVESLSSSTVGWVAQAWGTTIQASSFRWLAIA